MNVHDGGVILSTKEGWTYIAPDGKEKSGDDNISSSVNSSYYYGDYYYDSYDYYYGYYYYDAAPQLIDGTLYIAAGWDGIYSFNVK